jgi:hypothetical protein
MNKQLWKNFISELQLIWALEIVYAILIVIIALTTYMTFGQKVDEDMLTTMPIIGPAVVGQTIILFILLIRLIIRAFNTGRYRLLPVTTRSLVVNTLAFGSTFLVINNLFWRLVFGLLSDIHWEGWSQFNDIMLVQITLREITLLAVVTTGILVIQWVFASGTSNLKNSGAILGVGIVIVMINVLFNMKFLENGFGTIIITLIVVGAVTRLLPWFVDQHHQTLAS